MKYIPILFSTPMVQAILEGRKTMTRRVVKFPSINESEEPPLFSCSKYQPGDILWVRETWCDYGNNHAIPDLNYDGHYLYKADGNFETAKIWRPSIFMPKEACRLFLRVKSVRVERLQDMDGATAHECDSLKEGIMKYHHGDGNYGYHWKGDMDGGNYVHPEYAFKDLWQSINGADSWDTNPWVWVVEFERIEKPEGFLT